jgi:hypothetical protein
MAAGRIVHIQAGDRCTWCCQDAPFSHSDNGKCTSIIDCSRFPSLSSSPPFLSPHPHWGGSGSTPLPGPLLPPSPTFVRSTTLVAMTLGVSCTASSYVFGFGSVNDHFLSDSVALRRLTLIFSGTRGCVGPQGSGSCPANLRRPCISRFRIALWRTLPGPQTWAAQVRRLRGDWYGAKIL